MRNQKEIDLAILTLNKDRASATPMSMFGDDNIKIIDLSIELLEGKITIDELWEMEENEEVTDGERSSIESFQNWMDGDGEELVDLLWDEENLVTSLDEQGAVNIMCPNMCKECPFSNQSMGGWLTDYTREDILGYMNAEASFPCHMTMTDGDLSIEDCQDLIAKGKMKMCRGYTEMLIKSAKSPWKNEQLIKAIAIARAEGLSDNSMDIFKFIEHHKI